MQFSSQCITTRLKSFEFKSLDMDQRPISYSLHALIIVEILRRKLAFLNAPLSGKWGSLLFSEYIGKMI